MVGGAAQDIRGQILAHATRLFARQGFSGTSVQQIAERVGIRKPSLLYHFKSKDTLRREVVEQTLQHFQKVLPELLLSARDHQFDRVMGSLTGFFRDDPDRARLLVREILDQPEEMRERIAKYVTPWVQLLGDQLERAKERDLVRPDVDVEAYAMQVVTSLVANLAFIASMGNVLPDHGAHGAGTDRVIAEMTRIARASLYVDAASPADASDAPAQTPPSRERAIQTHADQRDGEGKKQ